MRKVWLGEFNFKGSRLGWRPVPETAGYFRKDVLETLKKGGRSRGRWRVRCYIPREVNS
jgi:hypothetical protein